MLPKSVALKRSLLRNPATAGWILVLPGVILLFTFLILPFFLSFILSLTNQRLIPNPNVPTRFIGLKNYLRLFTDTAFLKALFNNFYFVTLVVPVQTVLALMMALLINRRKPGIYIFRTIYFSPVVITMVVVSIVWYLLYNPDKGFINWVLNKISFGAIPSINWLTNTKTALPSIMILSIWQGAGFQMIIFLAGLQDIPEELFEAARVDGATKTQQFTRITLPMLRNTTLFVIISTSILAFKLFQQVWVMTKGGPQNSTITAIMYLYTQGFRQLKVGYASSIAVIFFIIVLAVSLIQRHFLKEK